jgi:hypothetical protein
MNLYKNMREREKKDMIVIVDLFEETIGRWGEEKRMIKSE